MVRVVIDVPDGSHLQLLADALAEAANMRTRAAGVAARDVIGDPSIADKRPDASRLLQVVADADWIRTVAEHLPTLVLEDAPAPAPAAAPDPYDAVLADIAGGQVRPAPARPPVAAPPPVHFQAAPARGHQLDLSPEQQAALRALTVPPGARLTPGAPAVDVPGPPQAAAEAQAALDSIAGGDDDAEILG